RLSGDFLARLVAAYRPDIDCYILSNLGLVAALTPNTTLVRAFRKQELEHEAGQLAFLRAIVARLRARYETPFWDALKEFAAIPKAVFHAMAGGDAKHGWASSTFDDFIDFYGPAYFQAEGSATTEPLDSLLSPHGNVQRAQHKFAQAFGADDALFVTGGTS